MKRFLVLAVFLALEGCGGVSLISLPKIGPKASTPALPPIAAGKNCPAAMTADLDDKPSVPAGVFIPKPTDPASQAGWAIFLNYMGNDYAGWANEGWRRAQMAKDWCAS